MVLARRVILEGLDEIRAHARRVGLADKTAKQVAKAAGRPAQVLLTGLAPGIADALRRAGRAPEAEDALPLVLTGGGDSALVAGSRWSVFALASRLGAEGDAGTAEAAAAVARCLSADDRPPPPLAVGGRTLAFGARTHVMGIVNVTPDSFSDGGRYLDPGAAVARGEALAEAGAAILDVGGESTRPGAKAVPADEEIARVVPVVRRLAKGPVPVSVDTTKAAVAAAALDAGAAMVNDVSGLLGDPGLAAVVAEAKVPVVVMHMRGDPRTMQGQVDYADLVGEVAAGLADAAARAEAAGVDPGRIVVDPGIGFAKRPEHNLVLLRRLSALRALGRPILVGPSRKSFIGHLTGAPAADRLPGTLAAITAAALAGAHLVRVHDVLEAVQALAVADAIRGADADGEAFAAPDAPGRGD